MRLGIDIGPRLTATVQDSDGATRVVETSTGAERLPAVVGVRDDREVVGQPAENERLVYPDRTVRPTVDGLESGAVHPLGERVYASAELWRLLLAEVSSNAGAQTDEGVTAATLIVPDDLGSEGRETLARAARTADVPVDSVLDRSLAACYAFDVRLDPDEAALVCHVDERSLACTLVRGTPHGLEVVATVRDTDLGAGAFDRVLTDHVERTLFDERRPALAADDTLRTSIRAEAVECRRELAAADEATVAVQSGGETLEADVTAAEFLDVTGDLRDDVRGGLDRVFATPLAPDTGAVTDVLLVGEDADLLPVGRAVADHLDADPTVEAGPTVLARAGATHRAADSRLYRPATSDPSTRETATDDAEADAAATDTREAPSANLDADDPFAVLGVARDAPLNEIKERAQELIARYDDPDAVGTVGDAFEEIQSRPHRRRVGDATIVPLLVEIDEPVVTVLDTVEVTVTDDRGVPVEGATVVSDNDRRGITDADGRCCLKMTEIGHHDIVVSKVHPDRASEYADAEVTVRVEREQRSLRFAECPDSATVGDPIRVRVVDEDGGVADVTVDGPATASAPTESDGVTEFAPSTAGEAVELTATKADTSTRSYDAATTTIPVRAADGE